MKTTGIFETHVYPIKVPSQTKPFHLVFFGDVHHGHPMFSADTWRRFVNKYKGRTDCYYIGMGDYQDFMSSSERRALSQAQAQLHEGSVDAIEEWSMDRVDTFTREIEWMGNRLIGLIEGNHYFQFLDGQTSTMKMAEQLKTKYLGVSAVIRLNLQLSNNCGAACNIWAHHGRAGGQLAGSPFNTVEKMQLGMDADIYVQGHDHSIGCIPKARMVPLFNGKTGELDIHERRTLLIRSGSFLRGYAKGKPSYIADAGLNPKPLGAVDVEMILRRDSTPARTVCLDMRGCA